MPRPAKELRKEKLFSWRLAAFITLGLLAACGVLFADVPKVVQVGAVLGEFLSSAYVLMHVFDFTLKMRSEAKPAKPLHGKQQDPHKTEESQRRPVVLTASLVFALVIAACTYRAKGYEHGSATEMSEAGVLPGGGTGGASPADSDPSKLHLSQKLHLGSKTQELR